MKKIIAYLWAITLMLLLVGCGSNKTEKDLVGTWWSYDGGTCIVFDANNRFSITDIEERTGTWSINKDEITMIYEGFYEGFTNKSKFTCSEDELNLWSTMYYRSMNEKE